MRSCLKRWLCDPAYRITTSADGKTMVVVEGRAWSLDGEAYVRDGRVFLVPSYPTPPLQIAGPGTGAQNRMLGILLVLMVVAAVLDIVYRVT